MVKRNHSYNIDEVVEATGGYLLKCKVAGTTSSDPIVIGGAELVDGTVTWQVIEDSDMPSDVYIIDTSSVVNGLYNVLYDGYLTLMDKLSSGASSAIWRNSNNSWLGGCNLFSVSNSALGNYSISTISVKQGQNIFIYPMSSDFQLRFIYSIKSAKKLGLL